MRHRVRDTDLPRCVFRRGKSYFYVKNGKWNNVGGDKETALATISQIKSWPIIPRGELLAFIEGAIVRARINAGGRRKIQFELKKEDALTLLEKAGYRCSVTGTEFTFDVICGKKPYAPSIDRIDSSKGYTMDNCRLVCVAANYAMNVWGEQVLIIMFHWAKRTKVLETRLGQLALPTVNH